MAHMAHQIRTIILFAFLLAHQTWGSDHPEKRPKLNFSKDSEMLINRVINQYLEVSHCYLFLENKSDRMNDDLKDLKEFFRKQSNDKRSIALQLIDYQQLRGGEVIIRPAKCTIELTKETPALLLREALFMEIGLKNIVQHSCKHGWDSKDFELAHRMISYLEQQTMIFNKVIKFRI